MKKFLLMIALAMAAVMPLAASQDYCGAVCDPCDEQGGSFDGFYLGGNLGVFTNTLYRNDLDVVIFPGVPASFAANQTDFTIGLQLGYDWLCGYKVFGIVADWNWVNIDHRNNFATGDTGSWRNENNWFTTIRARMGLAVCDALVYVTVGAAVTSIDSRLSNIALVDTFNHNRTHWGWTAGAGTEFILGCNWSLGLEALWLQFGHKTRTFSATVDDEVVTTRLAYSDSAYVGRVLLNYRFGDLCACWGR